MARTDNLTNYLTDVATAIKNKKGDNSSILASDFDVEIENLPTGGGKYTPRFISFRGCTLAEPNYETQNLDISNLTSISSMFYETQCQHLDLSNWKFSNLSYMSGFIRINNNLESINFDGWNDIPPNVTSLENFITNNPKLKKIDLSCFIGGKLSFSYNYMFSNNTGLEEVYLPNLTCGGNTSCLGMFSNCSQLQKIDMRSFEFTRISSSVNMFQNVPTDCQIIVKDSAQKEWFATKFPDMTNVITVSELEEE